MKQLFVNKKNFAFLRAALAVVLAVAVVAVSGFACVYQCKGPTAVQDGAQLADERYVSADVKWIMDVCGEEVNSAGKTLYYYAVAPVGNRFVLLRFGANMLDDLTALEKSTMDYLTGTSMAMDIHLPVRGMVEKAQPGAYSLLSEWFNNNIEWMNLAGVVGENPSASEYLANEVILVDQVGAMHYLASLGLTVLAALLVLYAVVELLLVASGFYKDSKVAARVAKRLKAKKEKEKAAAKEAEKAAEEAPAVTEEAPNEEAPTEEAPAEEAPAEEASIEEVPVEETAAAEEAPAAEETPVEETPAEEAKEDAADA